MQIYATIDDNLFKQAIEISGAPGTKTPLEQALRVFIASQSQPKGMAGCLSRYARPGITFAEEREIAWNEVANECGDS